MHAPSSALAIAKEILRKVFLPQIILVCLLIVLHWILVSWWLLLHHETSDPAKLVLIGFLGGSLPVGIYTVWGIRRFVIKAYVIVHERIVQSWLKEYCDGLAKKIIDRSPIEDGTRLSILLELRTSLDRRAEKSAPLVRALIKTVVRKLGLEDLDLQVGMLKHKNTGELSAFINKHIGQKLIEASNAVVPPWIVYLIPMNTILFITLWFI